MRRPDLAVATALLAVFGGMVVGATAYPPAARLLPLVVGIPAILLTAWELLRQWRTAPAADEAAAHGERASQSVAFLWFVGFVMAIVTFGFVIGGVAAVAVLQRFWLRESWKTALAGGALAFVILFAGIERGLGQPLFEGVAIAWGRGWLGI